VGSELDAAQVQALGDALRDGRSGGVGTAPAPDELADAVMTVVQRARAAWPNLKPVALDRFFAHLGGHIPDGPLSASAISGLVIEDLYLAFACAENDPAALRAFEQQFEGELTAAYDKFNVPAANRSDARQQLWEKLFVGAPRPRILEYSGRGALRYWFRVTVLRALVDDVRAEKRSREIPDEDALLGAASGTPDPEIEHLKRLYRQEFTVAFEEAIRALGAEERNALRSYYAQQLTIDEIAAAFGIHRATAARRVAAARERLLRDTRRRLSERLSLSSRELESIFHLIESRLHISVGRLLR
jgi:RNA polymerase sigma-70 factor (ECF subfamily)